MKTMKIAGTTLKIIEKEMTYNEAIKATPKDYKMINLTTFARIHEEVGTKKLNFWFWIQNYKWNEESWRPVARGYDFGNYFDLDAYYGQWACRGVYVKNKSVQK